MKERGLTGPPSRLTGPWREDSQIFTQVNCTKGVKTLIVMSLICTQWQLLNLGSHLSTSIRDIGAGFEPTTTADVRWISGVKILAVKQED